MLRNLAACAALLFLTGCAAKQTPINLAYVLRPKDQMLIPPGGQEPSRARVEVKLGKARLGRQRGNACAVKTGTVSIVWNKSDARLSLDTAGSDNPNQLPLSTLEDIGTFREKLVALETNGCLKRGESGVLLTRILEGVAMPARLGHSLRYGSVFQGFMDIRPPMRMRVVVPLKEGPVVGFETAWYHVDNGRLKHERVEVSRKGVVTVLAKPQVAMMPVSAAARYYRVFFLTRRSANDHDILLLTAKTEEELNAETAKIRADSEGACKRNPSCILVPQGSAVSAETEVTARGQRIYVPLAGNVSDALRVSGVRQVASVKNVRVSRPFGKQLAPITYSGNIADILGLVLIGGERVDWED